MTLDKQSRSASNDDPSVEELEEPLDGLTVLLFLGGLFGLFAMLATFAVSGLQLNAGDNARFPLGTGQFGDSFGFVTSIFTGLAFLGLLISVRLQRKELSEIKKERNDTKKMLKSQIDGADQAQASRESRDLLDQIFMLIERIRERNLRSLQNLEREEEKLRAGYDVEVGEDGALDFAVFRDVKLASQLGKSGYPHSRSLEHLEDNIIRLMLELNAVSESTTNVELAAIYHRAWQVGPVSSDSSQSLVELTLNLETRLWDRLADTELRLDYRRAVIQLLDEAVDDRFRCVFAASILTAAFQKKSYNRLIWHLVKGVKWHGLHAAETKINQIMQVRQVVPTGMRIETIIPDKNLETE